MITKEEIIKEHCEFERERFNFIKAIKNIKSNLGFFKRLFYNPLTEDGRLKLEVKLEAHKIREDFAIKQKVEVK